MAELQETQSLQEIWKKVSSFLFDYLGQVSYEAYVEKTCELVKIEDDEVYITCNNVTSQKVLTSATQFEKIKRAFYDATNTNYVINILTKKEYSALDKALFKANQLSNEELFDQSLVSKKDTFDSFVVGLSNKQAYNACKLICSGSETFNLLFIYADSGLGKTHLLSAVFNEYKAKFPDKKIKYVCINDFVEMYVRYVREEQSKNGTHKVSDIKDYFVDADCVLFDDIQFLSSKKRTQEVFFDIFNKLLLRDVPVILTSDCSPDHIKDLDKRLVSRFSSGLSCFIKIPEKETMIDILKKKIEYTSLNLNMFPYEVLDYLVSKNSINVRKLEGALNRLVFLLTLHKEVERIDMNFVRMAFEDNRALVKEGYKNKTIGVDDIIAEVSNHFNLTIAQLKSKVRTSQISYARQIAMYLCRDILQVSLNDIGRAFGKDHTTVIDATKKINARMEEDPQLKKTINKLKNTLTNK